MLPFRRVNLISTKPDVGLMLGKSHLAWVIGLCGLLLLLPAAAQNKTGGQDPGTVTKATFTTGIADGAPIDYRQEFDTGTPVIYFYTEVLGLQGQSVTHRWKREGKVMQEVAIPVKREREGVWSKSSMQPEWTGSWIVEVLDGQGKVIERYSFSYSPPL